MNTLKVYNLHHNHNKNYDIAIIYYGDNNENYNKYGKLVDFIESNKGLVIQSAISEVMSVVGFVKSQIKTIIIDIKEKF